MDRYDPEKRVALIVDEWGTWFEVEPGTHPRFLYQQNTMRDALVASISLNIFNKYSDRVRMANIAQTVNVLQAMVLTDGPRMLLTPTYHVFDMYKGHQDATSLPVHTESEQYSYGEYSMDKVSASASRADDGSILVTMNNLDTKKPAEIKTVLRGTRIKNVSGRILSSSSMHLHNTFDEPDRLSPQNFAEFKAESDELKLTVPPMSVVALRIES